MARTKSVDDSQRQRIFLFLIRFKEGIHIAKQWIVVSIKNGIDTPIGPKLAKTPVAGKMIMPSVPSKGDVSWATLLAHLHCLPLHW